MNTNLFNAVDAGHTYELMHHDNDDIEIVHFMKKELEADTGEVIRVQEGTTNEAVISMLIDRIQVLNEQFPSTFNEKAIHYLHLAYEELVARTNEREARGVEGTMQA